MAEAVELPRSAGLGTASFGSGPGWEYDWGPSDGAEAESTIRAAVSGGVGWIDTAPFYGWGRAERILGSALQGLENQGRGNQGLENQGRGNQGLENQGRGNQGLGERPVLLTKCGVRPASDGGSFQDHSAAIIRADLEASLARLRCSSVDVLQLHHPDPATPIEASWQTVCGLVAEGKAAAGGLSNHPVDLMDRALAVGPVSVVQHQYSLLHRMPESDGVLDWCAEHGIAFVAWSPLAAGFLADGFDLAALRDTDFRRRLPWADGGQLDIDWLRGELAGLGREAGLSMSALAVGWVLANGARPIVGARSPAEAEVIAGYRPLPADLAAAARHAVQRAAQRA
jgi:aryl-alcohol dehydrogenase-like predicted oxidoreductase